MVAIYSINLPGPKSPRAFYSPPRLQPMQFRGDAPSSSSSTQNGQSSVTDPDNVASNASPSNPNDELARLQAENADLKTLVADLKAHVTHLKKLVQDHRTLLHNLNNALCIIVGSLECFVLHQGGNLWINRALAAAKNFANLIRRHQCDNGGQNVSQAEFSPINLYEKLAESLLPEHSAPQQDEGRQSFRLKCSNNFESTEAPLQVMLNGDLSLRINADWPQLQLAFCNLFKNAAEAGATEIKITFVKNSNSPTVTLFILDNGKGIPQTHQADLFTVGHTSKSAQTGHGLGLASVKQIIEAHGGKISLVGSSKSGTTFKITLPVVQST